MKKKSFTAIIAIAISLLSSMTVMAKGEKVEVMLLHPGIKCPTCAAIKENTLKVVQETFKKEVTAGTIQYNEVIYGPDKNADLKEKYDVEMTTIVLVQRDNEGKEIKHKNLGKFPASYARTNPEKYRKELAKYIYFFMK